MFERAATVAMRLFAEGFIGLGLIGFVLHDLVLPGRAIYQRPRFRV